MNRICLYTFFAILWSICTGCNGQENGNSSAKLEIVTASVVGTKKDVTAEFAREELERFLTATGDIRLVETPGQADWTFELTVDTQMEPYSFGYETSRAPRKRIRINGPDSACLLHGVYTLLEDMGYLFDITGPVYPNRMSLEKIQVSNMVRPVVLKRGISEHVNFPMDVSAYPIDEAKEYIRNLARMRMNAITFHSYPNQWLEVSRGDKTDFAGSFFYGQRHDVPQDELLKRILRNEKTYCIPEIEPYFDDQPRKSALAVQWMASLMTECKRAGMTVGMSFESRRTDQNTESTLETAKAAVRLYPMLDRLELRTQEYGPWGPGFDSDQTRQIAKDHFGPDVLEKYPKIAEVISRPKGRFNVFLGELGHNIRAIEVMRKHFSSKNDPEIIFGVYCTVPEFLDAVLPLMRDRLDPSISWALMPGHGAWRTARHMPKIDFQPEDLRGIQFYNWVEFDGIIYLQQMCVSALQTVMQQLIDINGTPRIDNIVYLPWHHAECRTNFRYASVSAFEGPVTAVSFYRDYARKLGVEGTDSYVRAMLDLEKADAMATDSGGPSLGFCFVQLWGKGLGLYGKYNIEIIEKIRRQYESALTHLQEAERVTRNQPARKYLSFLDNRIRYTITYLKGQAKGTELQEVVGDKTPAQLSKSEQEKVIRICDQALALMNQAMTLMSEKIADRGTEGHLISLYYTPVAVLKRIRQEYGGAESDVLLENLETPDAPPMPIIAD